MKLTIEIDLDNAAFAEDRAEELARILNLLAYRLPDRPQSAPINLYDVNGNNVGHAELSE